MFLKEEKIFLLVELSVIFINIKSLLPYKLHPQEVYVFKRQVID